MIYLYDKALAKDLQDSFAPNPDGTPTVRVIDPEGVIDLAAQMGRDEIVYPVVALHRNDPEVDQIRTNFVRQHSGVRTVMDPKTNIEYYEKSLPIQLSYDLTAITTNLVDQDEIIKEIMFKYLNMYFLTIDLPYECKRKIRFGVSIDPDVQIERTSSTYEYTSAGKLYESTVRLNIHGAVMVSYTPVKLKHISSEIEIQS